MNSFNKNIFYDFVKGKTSRPSPLTVLMLNQYRNFLLEKYNLDYHSSQHETVDIGLNVLIVQRMQRRLIQNVTLLASMLQNMTFPEENLVHVRVIDGEIYKNKTRQMEHLSCASVILSSHGANCVDNMFARNGTVFIEIESSDHREEFYNFQSYYFYQPMYTFRTSEKGKDVDRNIDWTKFEQFFKLAVCHERKNLNADNLVFPHQSRFCEWVGRTFGQMKTPLTDLHYNILS